MNEPDDDEITELEKIDVDAVSAVESPATGTPFLLLKSIDPSRPPVTPTATPTKENTVKTPKSAAAKSIRKSLKAQRKAHALQKSALKPRLERVKTLKKLLKSTPDNVGVQYQLAKEMLSAASEHDRLIAAMQRGLVPPSQASAIASASAPAIASAQGAAVNRRPLDQRGSLVSVFNDSYKRNSPADLPGGDPTLPSLVEIHELEKELREAPTPEARERIGYTLTRLNLLRAHKLGEI